MTSMLIRYKIKPDQIDRNMTAAAPVPLKEI